MLQQFSWTTFLIFFAIVTALWYLALLFTVYRKEAKAFISGSISRPPSLSPGKHVSEENQSTVPELDIMGKSRMPEGLDLVGMGALNFSVGDHSTYSNEDQKLDQLGLVPDVIQELKEIFGILEKENGSKQDFFAMAAMISEKYGRIGSNPNIGKINEFIRDHSPFAITQEELEYLWD
ncbi:hypothetical protein EA772_01620 [Pedobacter sp. G11]|uniref:hypothetical protein n=1 Tax=Pedobacter sp. G11 TaxID=2482728 RepID=UPI000F5FB3FC|nr:hypothetical protein [Pedobacter sp. G11]AZI24103.1 hypothetical protein EA772_01620 [Pedobacter sp. G11]